MGFMFSLSLSKAKKKKKKRKRKEKRGDDKKRFWKSKGEEAIGDTWKMN